MSNLIACQACKSEIAKSAKTCPKCGAENKYVHAFIKDFLDSNPKVIPQVGLKAHGDELVGSVMHNKHIGIKMFAFGIVFYLGSSIFKAIETQPALFMGLYIVQCASIVTIFLSFTLGPILSVATLKIKRFTLDLSNERFEWKTDEEEFFKAWKALLKNKFDAYFSKSKSA
jgi:hypothetical protein